MFERMDIVCVSYGRPIDTLEAQIKKYFPQNKYRDRLVIVDTSKDLTMPSGVTIPATELNACFEFSGYFYGIKYLFELGRSESVQCMVINNTIFDTHFIGPFWYAYWVYSKQIGFAGQNIIAGKVDKRHHGEIIPTCQFFLKIQKEIFDERIFNASSEVVSFSDFRNQINVERLSVGRDNVYHEHVKNWLEPKTLYGGWYQAHPGRSLPLETVRRKKLTIFLEHSMCHTAKRNGILVKNINKSNTSQFLFLLDRAYQIFKKISFRMRNSGC